MPEMENTKKGFFKGTVLPVGLSFATAVTSFLPSKASAENAANKTQKFEGPYVIFDKGAPIIVDRDAVAREIQRNSRYVRGGIGSNRFTSSGKGHDTIGIRVREFGAVEGL